MTFRSNAAPAVGISISDSPDLKFLGLSNGHLRDAMAETALQLLALGRSLAYGGDLRPHGFTRLLHELLVRYRGHPRHTGTIDVTSYLAWPVHISMTPKELAAISEDHEPAVKIVLLSLDGSRLELQQRQRNHSREPRDCEWSAGLTAMRSVMLADTCARVVLGGRVEGFKGTMPGIAEEALLSLKTGQPTFVLGGFGGCARDIAETLQLVDRWAGSRGNWPGRNEFCKFSSEDLKNGLSQEDNKTLARTPYIEEAVRLVARGLRQIHKDGQGIAQSIH